MVWTIQGGMCAKRAKSAVFGILGGLHLVIGSFTITGQGSPDSIGGHLHPSMNGVIDIICIVHLYG